jgi:bacterial/archaeal transporter family-2 protein
VRHVAGSPASATLINFVVGTSALVVAVLVSLPFIGLPESLPGTWWLWTGGAIGTVLIAIQVSTVSIIGVLGLGVSIVTGQLVGSILLDIFVPVGNSTVTLATLIGAVITLVGALAVTLSRRNA